jgi:hypothetical protein
MLYNVMLLLELQERTSSAMRSGIPRGRCVVCFTHSERLGQ